MTRANHVLRGNERRPKKRRGRCLTLGTLVVLVLVCRGGDGSAATSSIPILQHGHTLPIASVAVQDDFLLTGGDDGMLVVRSVKAGAIVGAGGGHGAPIVSIATGRASRVAKAVSASTNGRVCQWQLEPVVEKAACFPVWPGSDAIALQRLVWSPDNGTMLVHLTLLTESAVRGTAVLMDLQGHALTADAGPVDVRAIAVAPDQASYVVLTEQGIVTQLDARTGAVNGTRTLRAPGLTRNVRFSHVAFGGSSDSPILVVATAPAADDRDASLVYVYRWVDNETIALPVPAVAGPVDGLGISADGQTIFAAGPHWIGALDNPLGGNARRTAGAVGGLKEYKAVESRVRAIATAPDIEGAVFVVDDERHVWRWQSRTAAPPTLVSKDRGVAVTAVEPVPLQASIVAAGEDGSLRFWSIGGARPDTYRAQSEASPLRTIAVDSSKGTPRVACGDNDGRVLVLEAGGRSLIEVAKVVNGPPRGPIVDLEFSAAGDWLAILQDNQQLEIVDPNAGWRPFVDAPWQADVINDIAVASGVSQRSVLLATSPLRAPVSFEPRSRTVRPFERAYDALDALIAADPDRGRVITLSSADLDSLALVWDVSRAVPCARPDVPGDAGVASAVALLPPNVLGGAVVTGFASGRITTTYRTGKDQWEHVEMEPSHAGAVRALAVFPITEGGTSDITLVSASDDGTLRVWNPNTGALLLTFAAAGDGGWTAFHPGGSNHGEVGTLGLPSLRFVSASGDLLSRGGTPGSDRGFVAPRGGRLPQHVVEGAHARREAAVSIPVCSAADEVVNPSEHSQQGAHRSQRAQAPAPNPCATPAYLEIRSAELLDNTNDHKLEGSEGGAEGGEVGSVRVSVTNTGKGAARGLRLLAVEGDAEGLSILPPSEGVTLEPGASTKLYLPIQATNVSHEITSSLRVVVSDECSSAGKVEALVAVEVIPRRHARLVAAFKRLDDSKSSTTAGNGNGRIEAGELLKLVFSVSNVGDADAADARVRLGDLKKGLSLPRGVPAELAVPLLRAGHSLETFFLVKADDALSAGTGLPVSLHVQTPGSTGVAAAEETLVAGERFIHTQIGCPADMAVPRRPNDWALVIGVTGYPSDIGEPPGSPGDVRVMKECLTRAFGVPPDHILEYTEAGTVTRTTVMGALQELADRKQNAQGGRVYVYFSGHGTILDEGEGKEHGRLYLLPVDVSRNLLDGTYTPPTEKKARWDDFLLSVQRVVELADGIPAEMVIVMLDACYAGGYRLIAPKGRNVVSRYRQSTSSTTRVVLLGASGPGETAKADEDAGTSVFTARLVRFIQQEHGERRNISLLKLVSWAVGDFQKETLSEKNWHLFVGSTILFNQASSTTIVPMP